jgi:hypothetical protein
MTKVVYNSCYGGFNLSTEAIQRYWEIKGQQVWFEFDKKYPSLNLMNVWLVPPNERIDMSKNFNDMSRDERVARNEAYSEQTWYCRSVDRHDPILVQVVEELGEKANGDCANLAIKEVSGPYRIDEYDGAESVETPDSYIDWITP